MLLSSAVESSREVRRRASMAVTRRQRTLQPMPSFRKPTPRSSVKSFLAPSALPVDCRPESVDVTFKSPLALLRRLTRDTFDSHHRYMFIFKPLARANIVLLTALLDIPGSDLTASKDSPMSPELRAAVLYVACNSFRSVYGMAYAGQMKSLYKAKTPDLAEVYGKMIIAGFGLSETENIALDFAQQLSLLPASELGGAAIEKLARAGKSPADMHGDRAAALERQVTGLVSYAAFMCRAFGALDVELSYPAVKYAASSASSGLHWSSAGRHFNFDTSAHEDMNEHVGTSRHGPKPIAKESRQHRRRLPNLLSSSVTVPRLLADAGRVREAWLQAATVPKCGALLEMNDCIASWFGFSPFYLSVSAVLGQDQRRALLFGAKELLFSEGELTRRLKFIICYVSSLHISGIQKRGDWEEEQDEGVSEVLTSKPESKPQDPDRRRRSTRPTYLLSTIMEETDFGDEGPDAARNFGIDISPTANDKKARGTYSAPQEGFSPTTDEAVYDGAGIIQAHAAFLACKYGATAAELVAAADESGVSQAMERYLAQSEDDTDLVAFPVGFPLTKKDCAAVLIAYSLSKSPPDIPANRLHLIEPSFGKSPFAHRSRGGRNCHQALMEIIGAASMWGLLERYCAGAVTFDVDYSANLYFGEDEGGCEPEIASFCRSPAGKKIGLAQNYKRSKQARIPRSSKRKSSLEDPVMLNRISSGCRSQKTPRASIEPDPLGSRSSTEQRSVSFIGNRFGRLLSRSSVTGQKF